MNYRYDPRFRGYTQQPVSGQPPSSLPGMNDPFFGGSSQNLPAVQQGLTPGQLTPAAPAKAGGGFSFSNISDLKNVIDRMGGIDGIINTVTKMQKVMASVQQMAPMVKLLMGSFGKKGSASKSTGDDWEPGRRRRRRRRRYGTNKKRTRASSGKQNRPRR